MAAKTKGRVLIIAPHADDEVFGCGGTMARLSEAGYELYLVIVSLGAVPLYGTDGDVLSTDARETELDKAARELGVRDYDILYRDQERHLRLDQIPRRDLMALLEADGNLAFTKIRPKLCFVPSPSSNQDHEAVFRACHSTLRPPLASLSDPPRAALIYESPYSSWAASPFRPEVYVNVEGFLDRKLKALECYASQSRDYPHALSHQAIRELACTRGREAGLRNAEAFQCMRMVW